MNKQEFATLDDLDATTNVVGIAYQIIDMHKTICKQRAQIAELEQYRKDYFELLNSSMEHSDTMMHNLMKVILTDGVSKAFAKNGKAEDFKA